MSRSRSNKFESLMEWQKTEVLHGEAEEIKCLCASIDELVTSRNRARKYGKVTPKYNGKINKLLLKANGRLQVYMKAVNEDIARYGGVN